MSMLAERRERKRYNLVPRGKALYEDGDRFGTRMLERMGWSKGKGLGAREHGEQDFVRIRYKNDSGGLGFEDRNDQWTQHESEFNGLLENLSNGWETTNEKDDKAAKEGIDDMPATVGFGFSKGEPKTKVKLSGESLEEKSKKSRARVHYKKFTRGKDLAQYSEKDLANIFGKKTLGALEIADKSKAESGSESDEMKDGEKKETAFGVVTISSGKSIDDYFKTKLKQFKQKFKYKKEGEADARNEVNEANDNEEEEQRVGFGFTSSSNPAETVGKGINDLGAEKSKKRKIKGETQIESITAPDEDCLIPDDISRREKKTKKRRKNVENEMNDIVAMCVTKEDEIEVCRKKVKHLSNTLDEPFGYAMTAANALDIDSAKKMKKFRGVKEPSEELQCYNELDGQIEKSNTAPLDNSLDVESSENQKISKKTKRKKGGEAVDRDGVLESNDNEKEEQRVDLGFPSSSLSGNGKDACGENGADELKSKKRKNRQETKNKSEKFDEDKSLEQVHGEVADKKSKKKSRNFSDENQSEVVDDEFESKKSKKQKLKYEAQIECVIAADQDCLIPDDISRREKKAKKRRKNVENETNDEEAVCVTNEDGVEGKRKKVKHLSSTLDDPVNYAKTTDNSKKKAKRIKEPSEELQCYNELDGQSGKAPLDNSLDVESSENQKITKKKKHKKSKEFNENSFEVSASDLTAERGEELDIKMKRRTGETNDDKVKEITIENESASIKSKKSMEAGKESVVEAESPPHLTSEPKLSSKSTTTTTNDNDFRFPDLSRRKKRNKSSKRNTESDDKPENIETIKENGDDESSNYKLNGLTAEKFYNVDIDGFPGSNLPKIVGYGLDKQVKLEVFLRPTDALRIKEFYDKAFRQKWLSDEEKKKKPLEEKSMDTKSKMKRRNWSRKPLFSDAIGM